jgi:hypothetical protein
MAVVELPRVATAPWSIGQVCDAMKQAFIDAGLMTDWFDSFTNGGYEHRVLEVTYNSGKTYGKTYYAFAMGADGASGSGIWVSTSTGWNATTHYPRGAGTATGVEAVDWIQASGTLTPSTNGFSLISLSTSISFSITSYTSGGRAFFTLRTGTNWRTFTIDPAGTTFRSFYDLNLGYHSGVYGISTRATCTVEISSLYRLRRDLLLGSSMSPGAGARQTPFVVNSFALPVNYPPGQGGSPDAGFLLPGWTTDANPSAGSNLNPIFTGLRLTSIHAADLPSDFGITAIKNSNILAIQDNATVTAGVEEYEILAFTNSGLGGSGGTTTSNPAFLARTI